MTRSTITMLFLVLMSSTTLAGNGLYLDQSGADATVTIDQSGDSNTIGSSITSAEISSDAAVITLTQIGMTNDISMFIDGYGADVTVLQDGSLNTLDLSMGSNLGSDDSMLDISFEGDSNTANITVGNSAVSDDVSMTVAVTGDSNELDIVENGSNSSANAKISNVTITGDSNDLTLTKSGTGLQLYTHEHTGDNSTFVISQSGTVNNSTNVNTTGSNVSVTITQH